MRTTSQTDQFHISWTCFSRKHLIPVSVLSLNTSSSLHHFTVIKGNLIAMCTKKDRINMQTHVLHGVTTATFTMSTSSVWKFGVATWTFYNGAVEKHRPRTQNITLAWVELCSGHSGSPEGSQGWITLHWIGEIYTRRCNTRATRIISDPSHPRNGLL